MPSDERYRSWAMAPQPYRIVARDRHTPGSMTLALAAVDEREEMDGAPAGLPGQYWVVHGPQGIQVAAVTSDPITEAGGPLEITTLRIPCGRSFGEPGNEVGLRGPFGIGWDLEPAVGRSLLIIGWDAGMILLRPVINEALAHAGRHARVRIWLGGSARSALPEAGEWMGWAGHGAHVSIAAGAATMTMAVPQTDTDPDTTVALLAGPLRMMYETADALVAKGMPPQRIQLATHSLIQCTTGRCGQCTVGRRARPPLACLNGPVFSYDQLSPAGGVAC